MGFGVRTLCTHTIIINSQISELTPRLITRMKFQLGISVVMETSSNYEQLVITGASLKQTL